MNIGPGLFKKYGDVVRVGEYKIPQKLASSNPRIRPGGRHVR